MTVIRDINEEPLLEDSGGSKEITYLDSSFLGLQFSLHGTKHPSFPSEWRIVRRGVDQVADTRPLNFPKHFGSLIP